MKRKVQISKNGKQLRMPFKKTVDLSQQMDEDKKVYNLRVPKKKTSKNEVCKSTETPPKNLRTKNVKNYSLKVAKSKNVEKKVNINSPANVDSKRVPIYKTLEVVEEKVQNPEEIYEFISDDLPASNQKTKKRKRFRKPSVKQTKKLSAMQYNGSQKTKTKPIKNISKNVQLKEQEKQTNTKPRQNFKRNVYANVKNTGCSKNVEASSSVVLNQRPQQSCSNGPDSPVKSLLNTEDDMSNHSLIRQSISPISKTVDNLLIESPRNSADSFSQVQNVVQSTPQINKLLASQERKSLAPINLNKKSIDSEHKNHISSMTNGKLTSQNKADVTQIQKENVSLRKFGTVISNLNSVKNATTILKQSLLQQKQQLPTKAVLPLSSFENYQPDQEMQDDILPESSILTEDNRKVNNILSIDKSSKTKMDQLLNPLRFEYIIQSFKQKVSGVSKFKAENSKSQKENKNPEIVAGPSNSEKSKAVVLRQSNLNNFLNLDEMPKSTRISTVHGIFDDGNNSPISGKKRPIITDESNIENEFGLKNNSYSETSSPIKKNSVPIIATARDVARSVKGKLFVKARVKSCLTRRVPENMTKKTLVKNIFKKSVPDLKAPVNEEIVKESKAVCKNKCLMDDENEKSKNPMNNNEKNTNIVEDANENILCFMENENENNASFMEVENENNANFMGVENENNISFMEVESEKNAGHTEDENEINAGHTEDEKEINAGHTEDVNEINAGHTEDENEENVGHTEDENEENVGHTEDENNEKNTSAKSTENINVSVDPKTAYLVAISFSDTFDLLSENGDDVSSKIPDEIPLFVDLEPVHFSQPPRRSYKKIKKEICFNPSRADSESNSEEDDYEKPKKKRKKTSRLSKEEQKRMQQWIKDVNETFNEIEQFNLTIE